MRSFTSRLCAVAGFIAITGTASIAADSKSTLSCSVPASCGKAVHYGISFQGMGGNGRVFVSCLNGDESFILVAKGRDVVEPAQYYQIPIKVAIDKQTKEFVCSVSR